MIGYLDPLGDRAVVERIRRRMGPGAGLSRSTRCIRVILEPNQRELEPNVIELIMRTQMHGGGWDHAFERAPR